MLETAPDIRKAPPCTALWTLLLAGNNLSGGSSLGNLIMLRQLLVGIGVALLFASAPAAAQTVKTKSGDVSGVTSGGVVSF
jgi:hypothetical protein